MSQAKNVNGYLIKKLENDQWWACSAEGEPVAGPFDTEAAAVEVAAVLQDQPKAARRRPGGKL